MPRTPGANSTGPVKLSDLNRKLGPDSVIPVGIRMIRELNLRTSNTKPRVVAKQQPKGGGVRQTQPNSPPVGGQGQ